jgi:5-methylcytosine-specific restriction endonuclease McrA
MPIRAEEKHRYPADWKQIREHILYRAGQRRDEEGTGEVVIEARCEECGAENHVYGYRHKDGVFIRLHGEPTQEWDALRLDGIKTLRIVLTIAHLDHTPENCAPENLRALCQRCHNTYDMPTRARGRRLRAEKAAGVRELFEEKVLDVLPHVHGDLQLQRGSEDVGDAVKKAPTG